MNNDDILFDTFSFFASTLSCEKRCFARYIHSEICLPHRRSPGLEWTTLGIAFWWLLSLDLENCKGLSFLPTTHLPTYSLTRSFFPLTIYHYQIDSFICWLIYFDFNFHFGTFCTFCFNIVVICFAYSFK